MLVCVFFFKWCLSLTNFLINYFDGFNLERGDARELVEAINVKDTEITTIRLTFQHLKMWGGNKIRLF